VTPAQASRYEGLMGEGFLDAVFAAGDLTTIEGLWRAGEPALAIRLAPRMIALAQPIVTDLLLDEILHGSDAEPLAAAIVDTLTPGNPSLTPTGVDRLVTRLNDESPLSIRYQQRRPILMRWAIGQAGSAVDRFARSVVTAEVPTADASVRQAAYDRARGSKRLAASMAGDLVAQLQDSSDATTWPRAFDFVDSVLADVRPVSMNVGRLVSALLRLAPMYYGKPDFGGAFSGLAVVDAVPAIEEMVSGDS
jgi:hypothetical protein